MSLDPIRDQRLDLLLDKVSEEWLTTPNDGLDGDTPRQRLTHWRETSCLMCRAAVVWLIEDLEENAHDASDPRCTNHILANGITRLDRVCPKCKTEKLGGYL